MCHNFFLTFLFFFRDNYTKIKENLVKMFLIRIAVGKIYIKIRISVVYLLVITSRLK